jgi:hypothetical protein
MPTLIDDIARFVTHVGFSLSSVHPLEAERRVTY